MLEKLISLYGEEKGKELGQKLKKIISEARAKITCIDRPFWDEKDVFLITYPDSFQDPHAPTLVTLKKFLDLHLKDAIDDVHILPFYPYSSDRGFSITDYHQVKKEFGNWGDIGHLGKDYRLMTDLVLNHVSVKHKWFQRFLAGDLQYENYFIWFEEDKVPWNDLKKVIRGRTTPLVTPFETKRGRRFVWTTYSVGDFTDQVDLNYQNPVVLLEIIKILLNLLAKGVRIFRLDGASGIWKELGTTCKNLPQTHTIIKLFRQILDQLCPSALIITEATTSTLTENLKYFSDEETEAQMIYNFPLAPLILHAYYSGKVNHLADFVRSLKPMRSTNTYFNILDIHDGINVHAVKAYLPEKELDLLFSEAEKRRGKFSYRSSPDGGKTVKEMHLTWWSALNLSHSLKLDEPFELQLQKFITSRAIAMAIKGIPAIYYLSLFGKENDALAFERTKHGRDINRTNLSFEALSKNLKDPNYRDTRVFYNLIKLIKKRKAHRAFHPNAKQEVLSLDKRVFAVLRGEGKDRVIALHNVSKDQVEIRYEDRTFSLEPYGYIWDLV